MVKSFHSQENTSDLNLVHAQNSVISLSNTSYILKGQDCSRNYLKTSFCLGLGGILTNKLNPGVIQLNRKLLW